MDSSPVEYHAFTCLSLTISDPALDGVRTEHRFELRSHSTGAEVWRSSILKAPGGEVKSEARLLGQLSSRRVIELLVEIERSGLYEALPTMGLVQGGTVPETEPLVSMELSSVTETRELVHEVSADERTVQRIVKIIRDAIETAQEQSLSFAG